MDKGFKVVVIPAICIMAIVAIVIGAIVLPKLIGNTSSTARSKLTTATSTQKIEVKNLNLSYSTPTTLGLNLDSSPQAVVDFTVTNRYNSYLTTVGLTVDEANYGFSAIEVPAGQTQDECLSLGNEILYSSTTYNVRLTFTFADGTYQDYSSSYTTPVLKGQAQVTSAYLTLDTSLAMFSLTIKNTGNLPITSAKYVVDDNPNFQSSLPVYPTLMPDQTVTSGMQLSVSWGFQAGMAYPITIQITYADGSTSTIQTSVTAQ
jgi:hypothetical protein